MGVTEPECVDWIGIVVPVNPGGGAELDLRGVNTRRVVRGVNTRRVVLCVPGGPVLRVVKRGVVAGGGGGVA